MSSSVRIKTLAGSTVLDLDSAGYEIVPDGVSLPKAKPRRGRFCRWGSASPGFCIAARGDRSCRRTSISSTDAT